MGWDLSRPPVEEKIVEIMDVVEVLPEEAALKAKEEAEAKARDAEERLRLAEARVRELEAMGCHSIAIKDMAGLLRAPAATTPCASATGTLSITTA